MKSAGNLIEFTEHYAEVQGDKAAVCFRGECLTWRMLADAMRCAALAVRELGARPGDAVLYTSQPKPQTVALYLGILYAGCMAVHMDKNMTRENAAAICRETGAVLFLTDMRSEGEMPVKTASVRELWRKCEDGKAMEKPVLRDREEIAEMIYTTGTTGRPKGVMLSMRAVDSILAHTRDGIGIRGDDTVLIPLPLCHSLGLRVLRATLAAGATVVLQNGFAFAGEIERNLDLWHCTGLVSVPASMELMRSQMKERFTEVLSRFRYIENGAGSLTREQRKRLSASLPSVRLYNTWGSSETGGALFTDVHEAVKDPVRIATIGRPLPDIEIAVLDEEGRPFASDAGHPGRLALRGEMLMSGYCGREDLTSEALKDGWLVTGDMVYTDKDGFVYMLGRADDLINIGGEKVSPLEIENAASECPGIRECACIGVSEGTMGLGQVPVLFAAMEEGTAFDSSRIAEWLGEHIERIKLPRCYVCLDAVPRNRMQKIDRRALEKLWEDVYSAKAELVLSYGMAGYVDKASG